MNWIFDIVALAILCAGIGLGSKKGLIGYVFALAGSIIALIVSYKLCKPFSIVLDKWFNLTQALNNKILPVLEKRSVLNTTYTDIRFETALQSYSLPDFIVSAVKTFMKGKQEYSIAQAISFTVSKIICTVASYVILFIFFKIVTILAKNLLNKLTKLKLLGAVNKALGSVIGLAYSYLILSLILFILMNITVLYNNIAHIIDKTYIVKPLCNINIITFIFKKLFNF